MQTKFSKKEKQAKKDLTDLSKSKKMRMSLKRMKSIHDISWTSRPSMYRKQSGT